jgi:RHS repeat-associated protein
MSSGDHIEPQLLPRVGEDGRGRMNGRVYDPWLGRFLSPDNYVQQPWNSQSFNRYSYCFNNPLKFIDPSGYSTDPEKLEFPTFFEYLDNTYRYEGGGYWYRGSYYWYNSYYQAFINGQGQVPYSVTSNFLNTPYIPITKTKVGEEWYYVHRDNNGKTYVEFPNGLYLPNGKTQIWWWWVIP